MPTAFVRLHSKDRVLIESSSRSDFVVELKEKVALQQVRAAQIVSALVPNVFYNVRAPNNVLLLTQDGEAQATVTLTPGQYTITTFITMAKVVIDAALTGGSTVAITQNANTQLLTLTFSGGTNPNTALDVDDTSRNGWCIFGFDANSAEAAAHTATSIPNLRGLSEVYIHSKEIQPGQFFDGDTGSISAFVQVGLSETPFGGMAYFHTQNDQTDLLTYSIPRNLSRIRLVLRDSEGVKLDTGCSDVIVMLKIFY